MKKTGRTQNPLASQPASLPEGPVRILALECWRISKLIPQFSENRKHHVLRTSVNRMMDSLQAVGVAIDDPEGSEFKDGMTFNIAVFEQSDDLEAGRRIVTETLSPGIYIHNKLAHPARVIVSVGRKDSLHGA